MKTHKIYTLSPWALLGYATKGREIIGLQYYDLYVEGQYMGETSNIELWFTERSYGKVEIQCCAEPEVPAPLVPINAAYLYEDSWCGTIRGYATPGKAPGNYRVYALDGNLLDITEYPENSTHHHPQLKGCKAVKRTGGVVSALHQMADGDSLQLKLSNGGHVKVNVEMRYDYYTFTFVRDNAGILKYNMANNDHSLTTMERMLNTYIALLGADSAEIC